MNTFVHVFIIYSYDIYSLLYTSIPTCGGLYRFVLVKQSGCTFSVWVWYSKNITTAATTTTLSQIVNLPTSNESEEVGKKVYGDTNH